MSLPAPHDTLMFREAAEAAAKRDADEALVGLVELLTPPIWVWRARAVVWRTLWNTMGCQPSSSRSQAMSLSRRARA